MKAMQAELDILANTVCATHSTVMPYSSGTTALRFWTSSGVPTDKTQNVSAEQLLCQIQTGWSTLASDLAAARLSTSASHDKERQLPEPRS